MKTETQEQLEKEIEECEKIEMTFKEILKGCRKRTGYFEGNPYYCGDQVQTNPKYAFESYCRKCMPKVKEAMSRFDSIIVPARKRLTEIKEALKEL